MEETISKKSNKILISAILISISLVYGSIIITQSIVDLREAECEKIKLGYTDLIINNQAFNQYLLLELDEAIKGICDFDTDE